MVGDGTWVAMNMESKHDCTQLLYPCGELTQPDSQEESAAAPGGCRWHGSLSKDCPAMADPLPQ